MQFIVNSSVLLKKVQHLIGVIGTNNALPITQDFLFELVNEKLYVTATDLGTTIKVAIELTNYDQSGQITIPARKLLDFLKFLPDSPVTFKIDQEKCFVEIVSGEGRYQFSGHKANEFPVLPIVNSETEMKLDSSTLLEGVSKTVFATGIDDLRPAMGGVFFDFMPEKLTMVATDAHKLVRYIRSDIQTGVSTSFIIPRKSLTVFKNILADADGEVAVKYDEKNISFRFNEEDMFYCRLIEGNFPAYEAVIPKENTNKLVISRDSLIYSINRLIPFSNKSTNLVRWTIKGQELTINAEDYELSYEGVEKIKCQYSGEDMEIGFNSRYFLELLQFMTGENIVIMLGGAMRAVTIVPEESTNENEDLLMVVMPLLLSQ